MWSLHQHVAAQDQPPQTEEVRVLGVLDIDRAPGVLPASHLPSLPILHEDVAADHGEGKDLVTVEHVDLMLLQLSHHPLLEGGQLLPGVGVALADNRNDVDLELS